MVAYRQAGFRLLSMRVCLVVERAGWKTPLADAVRKA
jgi:hypothetical protein